MEMGLELLRVCDELWVFGERISEGIAGEIKRAKSLGLTVKRFNSRLEVMAL